MEQDNFQKSGIKDKIITPIFGFSIGILAF